MTTRTLSYLKAALADATGKIFAEVSSKIDSADALSKQAKKVLENTLTNKKATDEVDTLLKAKKAHADAAAALAPDPLNPALIAAEAAAAAAVKPLSKSAKKHIIENLAADDKAGKEIISKLEA